MLDSVRRVRGDGLGLVNGFPSAERPRDVRGLPSGENPCPNLDRSLSLAALADRPGMSLRPNQANIAIAGRLPTPLCRGTLAEPCGGLAGRMPVA